MDLIYVKEPLRLPFKLDFETMASIDFDRFRVEIEKHKKFLSFSVYLDTTRIFFNVITTFCIHPNIDNKFYIRNKDVILENRKKKILSWYNIKEFTQLCNDWFKRNYDFYHH